MSSDGEKTPPEPEIGEDSRVEDWFGQSVERDAELADELSDQGLAPDEAAAEFERRSTGRDEQATRHGEAIDPDQGRSAYTEPE